MSARRCDSVHKIPLFGDVIHSFDWKSATEHVGGVLIVYLARVSPAFVMYFVNGASRSYRLYDDIYHCVHAIHAKVFSSQMLLYISVNLCGGFHFSAFHYLNSNRCLFFKSRNKR